MMSMQIIVCFITAMGQDCNAHQLPDPFDADTCRRAAPIVELYIEREFRMESGYTGDMIVSASCVPEVSS
jgi:hypothetical protein